MSIIFHGNNELPELWGDKYVKDGTLNKLLELGKPNPLLGIIYGVNSDGSYHYMVGIETKGVVDGDMETIIIPASIWAVFESIGAMPNAIQNVWSLIFTDFCLKATTSIQMDQILRSIMKGILLQVITVAKCGYQLLKNKG